MLNYNMLFKIFVVFISLTFASGCSPLKEKLSPATLVELNYIDPELTQQLSDGPDHEVTGNLSHEHQLDLSTGKKTLYLTATFHEPTLKNILFNTIPTKALKNVFKPKPPPPVDQPCGIPGFPDCANPVTPPIPPPANTNPDQPCGIPGFPDCPPTKK